MQEAFGESVAVEDTLSWLEWTIASYRELARLHQPPYGDYAVVLKGFGEVIGSVGIVPAVVPWDVFDADGSSSASEALTLPEFGLFWAILPAHQGQGYAGEAAYALAQFLFHQLGARRIVALTEYDNLPSQRVMEKLGMVVRRNPTGRPAWCQVVGVLTHPGRQA
jgi:ribosomal-protein-alanine N-acetyltransferase